MGGSTRLPASYTGLVGMRPSTGRIPRRYGFPATAIDFQIIGPFARTMRDMRLLYGTLAGPGHARSVLGTDSAHSGYYARPSAPDRLVHRDR
jgi:aspartyl-tRNA(Asn)/glutamyl-tRNA(Gln) amidotransferase subunit A